MSKTILAELCHKIDTASEGYYNGTPTVPDSEFDGWMGQLRALDPDNVRLKRVGAKVPENSPLQKVSHDIPMGSLNNAMNEEEFLAWVEKVEQAFPNVFNAPEERGFKPVFNVSFKMDGASAELQYKNGRLVRAITRGDGKMGEDVTHNVIQMKNVPLTVKDNFTGSVRGEVMLYTADWLELDPKKESNPRNLGNGILRRKSGENADKLRFIAFRGYDKDGQLLDTTEDTVWTAFEMGNADSEKIVKTEHGMLQTLRALGFETAPEYGLLPVEHVLRVYRAMQGLPVDPPIIGNAVVPRDELPFEIDGLVVKVESDELQQFMGESDNRPKGQIAFKFPARGEVTKLVGITTTVGHTGAVVPTAQLAPVRIGGVTVMAASLSNWDLVARLGLRIGDMVRVVRAGDVIPMITEVVTANEEGEKVVAPTTCPCERKCKLERKTNISGSTSAALFCTHEDCEFQAVNKIKKWIRALDIQGLGDVYIDALFEAGVVTTVTDLYKATSAQLAAVASLGITRADKFKDELSSKALQLTTSQFLGALGIEGLGRRRVLIAQEKSGKYYTLEEWLSGSIRQDAALVGLPDTAGKIFEGIEKNMILVEQLKNHINIVPDEKPEPKKTNSNMKIVCITGKLSKPKEHFYNLIQQAGHSTTDTYTKNINVLVAADPDGGSSKLKKARKDGVEVISEETLMKRLENNAL